MSLVFEWASPLALAPPAVTFFAWLRSFREGPGERHVRGGDRLDRERTPGDRRGVVSHQPESKVIRRETRGAAKRIADVALEVVARDRDGRATDIRRDRRVARPQLETLGFQADVRPDHEINDDRRRLDGLSVREL